MRIASLPAMVLGIALAIVFFEVYGVVSRPSVPRPVAFAVDQFAPGVEIGAHVADARHHVAAMTYVQYLGYVGIPGSRHANLPDGDSIGFTQVRLLVADRERARPHLDPAKTRIEAVEMVTADPGAAGRLATAFETLLRRPPRTGCIRITGDDRVRDVRVWTTPNERGGIALISDTGRASPLTASAPSLTSVVAFTGKFQGGNTLRAGYIDAACADLTVQTPSTSAGLSLAVAASESLTVALADSLGASLGFVADQAGNPLPPFDACRDGVDGSGWESAVSNMVQMQLPPGFRSTTSTPQTVQWSGPGGWIRVSAYTSGRHGSWSGLITNECDVYISGAPTHIDLVTMSYGRGVHAFIEPRDAPPIAIEAQAKTVELQAQLLHAIHYANVSAAWGR